MIITACHFTRDAFLRAGVDCPIGVVPVPIRPDHFEVPDWDPEHTWTHTCRHLSWGGPPPEPPEPSEPEACENEAEDEDELVQELAEEPPRLPPRCRCPSRSPSLLESGSSAGGTWSPGRSFRKVYPWLGERTLDRIARTRHYVLTSAGRDPRTMEPSPGARPGLARLGYAVARDGYRRYFKRWLSHEALERITRDQGAGPQDRRPRAGDGPRPAARLRCH